MEKQVTEKGKSISKKSYQPPKVVSEKVFETLALACCKGEPCRKYGFPRGLHGVS